MSKKRKKKKEKVQTQRCGLSIQHNSKLGGNDMHDIRNIL